MQQQRVGEKRVETNKSAHDPAMIQFGAKEEVRLVGEKDQKVRTGGQTISHQPHKGSHHRPVMANTMPHHGPGQTSRTGNSTCNDLIRCVYAKRREHKHVRSL